MSLIISLVVLFIMKISFLPGKSIAFIKTVSGPMNSLHGAHTPLYSKLPFIVFNPLLPIVRTKVHELTKISILKLEGIIKKFL